MALSLALSRATLFLLLREQRLWREGLALSDWFDSVSEVITLWLGAESAPADPALQATAARRWVGRSQRSAKASMGRGRSKMIALRQIGPQLTQQVELGGGLDAFAHHAQLETVCHADHAIDDGTSIS